MTNLRAAAKDYLETQKLASAHGDAELREATERLKAELHSMDWWYRAWIVAMVLLVLLAGANLWIWAHRPPLTINVISASGKSTLP